MQQNIILFDKVFKECIGFSLSKVSLVRIHPHAFLSLVILYIFVNVRSNIYILRILNPSLESLVAILLPLLLSKAFEDRRNHGHDVVSLNAW